ncbi:MAG: metal-dependent transcriptional regulator [Promethearchaeota archaeon]
MKNLDFKVIKCIYKAGTPLKVGQIARKLNIPHSTIGSCVKRLEEKNLINYIRYKPVHLTEKGKLLALELIRHAQLLEVLLYESLGLTTEDAHSESDKVNLLFSCKTINQICKKYNHPKKCPCGEEILSLSGCSCNEGH